MWTEGRVTQLLYSIKRKMTIKLTIMSPSSGIVVILCLIELSCATVPSDLRTQLSGALPRGSLFRSTLFVAMPIPQTPETWI